MEEQYNINLLVGPELIKLISVLFLLVIQLNEFLGKVPHILSLLLGSRGPESVQEPLGLVSIGFAGDIRQSGSHIIWAKRKEGRVVVTGKGGDQKMQLCKETQTKDFLEPFLGFPILGFVRDDFRFPFLTSPASSIFLFGIYWLSPHHFLICGLCGFLGVIFQHIYYSWVPNHGATELCWICYIFDAFNFLSFFLIFSKTVLHSFW